MLERVRQRTQNIVILAILTSALGGVASVQGQGAQPYAVAEVTNGGTITGVAIFNGAPPAPKTLTISKDGHTCGEGDRLIGVVDVSKQGGLAGVVIEVMGIPSGKDWDPAAVAPVIDQVSCTFRANSWVVAKGKSIEIRNSDPVLHNIHAYELIGARGRRTMFNIGQPIQGQVTKKKMKLRKSNIVKIECDAHNFMHAHLYVASTPYYATSDADGRFTIDRIPAGSYNVTAWHPVLGEQKGHMEVTADKKATIDFTFGSKE